MKALVIGAGSIARRHLRNLRTFNGIGPIGVMASRGRILDARDLLADKLFTSLDEALEWMPERVIVASPAPFHLAQARRFAETGIAVLIEKPLSHDWMSCLEHQDWLIQHEQLLSVGYNLRYLPSAGFMKSYIAGGGLSALSSIHIDVGQYLPDWRPDSDYRTQVSAQRALGGGAILELSHEIDLLLWLMGQAQGVYCRARNTGQLEIDVEDTVDALFTLSAGTSVSLHMDFLQRARVRRFKLVCAEGNLLWNLASDTVDLITLSQSKRLFSSPSEDRNHSYIEELSSFIRTGRCAASIGEAFAVMRAIDAMKQSACEQRYIPLEGVHA